MNGTAVQGTCSTEFDRQASVVPPSRWRLCLLNGWELRLDGRTVAVPFRLQRLIAVLALRGEISRSCLGELLWPGSDQLRASNNLRVALWQASHALPSLLADSVSPLALRDGVSVDVHDFSAQLAQLDDSSSAELLHRAARMLKITELLPGWYDDLVFPDQQRVREQKVDGLERLARLYSARGDHARAVRTAQDAVALEPLRETPHRLIIQCHIRAGDFVSAYRAFDRFDTELRNELGEAPSLRTRALLDTIPVVRGTTGRDIS